MKREPPASDMRVVTFLTPDAVDVVQRHYDISMRWLRWSASGCHVIDAGYKCYYAQLLDGPSRSVVITMEPTSEGMTRVTLEMGSYGVDWNGVLPTK